MNERKHVARMPMKRGKSDETIEQACFQEEKGGIKGELRHRRAVVEWNRSTPSFFKSSTAAFFFPFLELFYCYPR